MPLQDLCVLVVEDEPDLAENLREILMGEGAIAVWAANGADGLAVTRQVRFDLIILDIGLPDMDGCHVAAQLRRDPHTQDTPIIALTGQTSPDVRDRALASGCDRFLSKPARVRDLLDSIAEVLS